MLRQSKDKRNGSRVVGPSPRRGRCDDSMRVPRLRPVSSSSRQAARVVPSGRQRQGTVTHRQLLRRCNAVLSYRYKRHVLTRMYARDLARQFPVCGQKRPPRPDFVLVHALPAEKRRRHPSDVLASQCQGGPASVQRYVSEYGRLAAHQQGKLLL